MNIYIYIYIYIYREREREREKIYILFKSLYLIYNSVGVKKPRFYNLQILQTDI